MTRDAAYLLLSLLRRSPPPPGLFQVSRVDSQPPPPLFIVLIETAPPAQALHELLPGQGLAALCEQQLLYADDEDRAVGSKNRARSFPSP